MSFLDISFLDVLDILMVAAIIYFLFAKIRNTAAMNIFIAIVIILVIRVAVNAIGMKMMSTLLGTIIDVGAVAIIVIFQPEIRHFLYNIGRGTSGAGRGSRLINRILNREDRRMTADTLEELASACEEMAEEKIGALIVLPHRDNLEAVISTGDRVDANISKRLIINIFFKNSPLHDGAMIMDSDRIIAARCTLPITERTDIPAKYGMRHKAAIGLSEKCDATIIVVSEQSGRISIVRDGNITNITNINALKLALSGEQPEN